MLFCDYLLLIYFFSIALSFAHHSIKIGLVYTTYLKWSKTKFVKESAYIVHSLKEIGDLNKKKLAKL